MNKKNYYFLNLFFVVLSSVSLSFSGFGQTLEEAHKLLDSEKFTAAEKAFMKIAQSAPTEENYYNLGYYYLNSPEVVGTNAYKEEVDEFNAALAKAEDAFTKGKAAGKKGKSPLNDVGFAMIKMAKGDQAGAQLMFDQIKKETKNKDFAVLNNIALANVIFPHANNPDLALSNMSIIFEKAKSTEKAEYYITKALANIIKNDGGEAMSALRNAERLNGNKARIYTLMGKLWFQAKVYKDAKEALEKAIAIDPEFGPAYRQFSSFYLLYQKYPEAANAAQKYLKFSDGDCGAKLRYVKLAFLADDNDNVMKTLDEIRTCNKDIIVDRLEGYTKFKQNKPAEAIALINKFLAAAKPEKIVGQDYGFLGRSYLALPNDDMRAKNDSLALLNISKAIEMQDSSYNYSDDLLKYYKANKMYKKAIDVQTQLIKKSGKEDASQYGALALLYYSDQDWDNADKTFTKVIELYRDAWPVAYIYKARSLSYKNKLDNDASFSSAPFYEKYLTLIPADKRLENKANVIESLNYLAGKAYQLDKDNVKAKGYANEILAIEPENTHAQSLISLIGG